MARKHANGSRVNTIDPGGVIALHAASNWALPDAQVDCGQIGMVQ